MLHFQSIQSADYISGKWISRPCVCSCVGCRNTAAPGVQQCLLHWIVVAAVIGCCLELSYKSQRTYRKRQDTLKQSASVAYRNKLVQARHLSFRALLSVLSSTQDESFRRLSDADTLYSMPLREVIRQCKILVRALATQQKQGCMRTLYHLKKA